MPAQEYEHRFSVWLDNLEYVIAHNARGASYWLGMTPLADLTHQEYKARALGFRADLADKARRDRTAAVGAKAFRYEDTSPPPEMDWVKKGAVTKVKNQQQVRLRSRQVGAPRPKSSLRKWASPPRGGERHHFGGKTRTHLLGRRRSMPQHSSPSDADPSEVGGPPYMCSSVEGWQCLPGTE